MRNHPKQKHRRNNGITMVVIGLVITMTILLYDQKQQANMAEYAVVNNCEWQYNGTFYWDDRDYTCK